MRVLLFDCPPSSLPNGAAELLHSNGWEVKTTADYRTATQRTQAGLVDALVLPAPSQAAEQNASLTDLIRAADAQRVATVLVTDRQADDLLNIASLMDVASPGISKEELWRRLATLERYQALVRRMEQELANMERLGKRLNQHFREVDQEMRLAGRLQRDFLPQLRDPVGPLRFSAIFRPASWVSGDIYDVFRVDEKHVAFYVADAVGHGMAASLLTMFIKKAVVAKHIHPDGYELLTPSQTMRLLNEALAAQELPNCQFVTACYCLVNTDTLEMQYSRGGHTYPLLVSQGGLVTELKSAGGLMGLFREEQFPTRSVQLQPGQKVVLYSDGLEVAYTPRDDDDAKWTHHRRVFDELAPLPADQMLDRIARTIDGETGSLAPRDDVTVVVMEITD